MCGFFSVYFGVFAAWQMMNGVVGCLFECVDVNRVWLPKDVMGVEGHRRKES